MTFNINLPPGRSTIILLFQENVAEVLYCYHEIILILDNYN